MNPEAAVIGDRFDSAADCRWLPAGPGIEMRVLRTSQETGTWIVIFKIAAGTTAQAHLHHGAAEYYMLSGKMELRGGVGNGGITAVAGDYGYEANGALHGATYFPEDTMMYFANYGPVAYLDDRGEVEAFMDWRAIREAEKAAA